MKQITVLLILFATLSCTREKPYIVEDDYIFIRNFGRGENDWKLVWEDNFDTPELDFHKWTKIMPNNADWGNFMTADPRCYEFVDGTIQLKGIVNWNRTVDSRPFLTGGIYTKGKFAFQYGKIEFRAKLENARGAWPAIWMLAEKEKYGKYPHNGEIDIMEHLNFDTIVYQTTHSHYTLGLGHKDNPPHSDTAPIDTAGFNVYGLSWYPDSLVFSVNGEDTFTYPRVEGVDRSQWPYDQPFYILIDQQLGGTWVGEIAPEDLPVNMIIDWVRVYQ